MFTDIDEGSFPNVFHSNNTHKAFSCNHFFIDGPCFHYHFNPFQEPDLGFRCCILKCGSLQLDFILAVKTSGTLNHLLQ